jgi:hypothetical protein
MTNASQWFGSQQIALKYGLVLGGLIFLVFLAGFTKVIINKQRLRKHIARQELESRGKLDELEDLNRRDLDEGDLFGVRAIESGFYGGVAQSRPGTARHSDSQNKSSMQSEPSSTSSPYGDHNNRSAMPGPPSAIAQPLRNSAERTAPGGQYQHDYAVNLAFVPTPKLSQAQGFMAHSRNTSSNTVNSLTHHAFGKVLNDSTPDVMFQAPIKDQHHQHIRTYSGRSSGYFHNVDVITPEEEDITASKPSPLQLDEHDESDSHDEYFSDIQLEDDMTAGKGHQRKQDKEQPRISSVMAYPTPIPVSGQISDSDKTFRRSLQRGRDARPRSYVADVQYESPSPHSSPMRQPQQQQAQAPRLQSRGRSTPRHAHNGSGQSYHSNGRPQGQFAQSARASPFMKPVDIEMI